MLKSLPLLSILLLTGCATAGEGTSTTTAPTTTIAAGPASTSPAPAAAQGAWSARMLGSILARHPEPFTLERGSERWSYSTSFLVYAMLRAGERAGGEPDARMLDYSKRYIARFVDEHGKFATVARYEPNLFKLDDVAPGRLLLALHERTPTDGRYLAASRALMEQLRRQPRTKEGGYWHKQIYPHQLWLDGIYMDCPFMATFGRIANEPAWFDEAAKQIVVVGKNTRDPKTGLHYHAWDESRSMYWADPQTGLSQNFWGRAVGWYAMGIVETLDIMPADHPRRGEVVEILKSLADAIAKVQDPQTGVWWQVLNQPGRGKNYLESSASSMFVFAMLKGVRLGVLDAKHAEVARRGYAGMLQQFIETDPQTGHISLKDTCQVAGLGGTSRRDGSFEYYMSEPRISNDPKGLAPFILASLEMERAADRR